MIVLLVTDKDGVSTHLNIGCVDMAFTTVGILVDEHPNVANILVTKTDAPFEDRDEAEYKRAGEYQEFVTGVMQKFEEQVESYPIDVKTGYDAVSLKVPKLGGLRNAVAAARICEAGRVRCRACFRAGHSGRRLAPRSGLWRMASPSRSSRAPRSGWR